MSITQRLAQRVAMSVTLAAGKLLNVVAVSLYNMTGLAAAQADQATHWLEPRIDALEERQATVKALRREGRRAGREFRRMARRLGWTIEDLRGLAKASDIPWDGDPPELDAGPQPLAELESPEVDPWVSARDDGLARMERHQSILRDVPANPGDVGWPDIESSRGRPL